MKIKIIRGDFLKWEWASKQFDLIVSNPPYRKINSGRTNPDEGKAISRHELKLSLSTMLNKAKPILKRGGHITLAYPPIRLQDWGQLFAIFNQMPSMEPGLQQSSREIYRFQLFLRRIREGWLSMAPYLMRSESSTK
mgnify:CR=1 FL=1